MMYHPYAVISSLDGGPECGVHRVRNRQVDLVGEGCEERLCGVAVQIVNLQLESRPARVPRDILLKHAIHTCLPSATR